MVQGLLTSCEKTWVIYTIKEINEQIYKIHLFSGGFKTHRRGKKIEVLYESKAAETSSFNIYKSRISFKVFRAAS